MSVRRAENGAKGLPVRVCRARAAGDVMNDRLGAGDDDGGDGKLVYAVPLRRLQFSFSAREAVKEAAGVVTDEGADLDHPDVVVVAADALPTG